MRTRLLYSTGFSFQFRRVTSLEMLAKVAGRQNGHKDFNIL